MGNITIEILKDDDIEQCRELCNELMKLQQEKSYYLSECFDMMNFDTRMKQSYEKALEKQVILVKDGGKPVGYIFSTIEKVAEEMRDFWPEWAPKVQGGLGFYPTWLELPQKIGCLSNLYLRKEYQGLGLGSKLCDMAMEWLGSFPDAPITFVYASNGNDAAYDFYLKRGFIESHDVFGEFIKAAYYKHS